MDQAESFVLLPPKQGGMKSICYPKLSNSTRNKNERVIGWCGTCQPGARPGSPGYCGPGAATNTANYAEVSAGRGWGYCTHDCTLGQRWSGADGTNGRVSSEPRFLTNHVSARSLSFRSSTRLLSPPAIAGLSVSSTAALGLTVHRCSARARHQQDAGQRSAAVCWTQDSEAAAALLRVHAIHSY